MNSQIAAKLKKTHLPLKTRRMSDSSQIKIAKIRARTERLDYFDIAKGIGIILVIIGHALRYQPESISTRIVIYSFHMPFFFMCAGYFISEKQKLTAIIKNRAKSLLIPYIITVLIGTIISLHCDIAKAQKILLSGLYGAAVKIPDWNISFVGYIWFLPTLFISISIASIFIRRRLLLAIPSLIVINVVAYLVFKYFNFEKAPFFVLQGMYCALFVYLGFLSKKTDVLNKKYTWILLIIAIIAFHMSLDTKNIKYIHRLQIHNEFSASIAAITGSFILVYLSKLLDHVKILRNILIYLGSYSLIILCVHQISVKYVPSETVLFYTGIDFYSCPFLHIMRDLISGSIVALVLTKILTIYRLKRRSRN